MEIELRESFRRRERSKPIASWSDFQFPTSNFSPNHSNPPWVAERRGCATLRGMKRKLAWMAAIISGIYLLLGPLPDPIPLLDEATALWLFVNAMKSLGYDVTRWLPFLGKGATRPKRDGTTPAAGQTIDV
jgi:hypothetical protein